MQQLHLAKRDGVPLKILCLGAHSDDIEIGAGGAILTLLRRRPDCHVHWVVFSANECRAREARASAKAFLAQAGQSQVTIHAFRDAFFPEQFGVLKQAFEALRLEFDPDLIFSHYGKDAHQDHRVISELTGNTFRDHLILQYEVIKYDPDLGNPNVFVTLDPEVVEQKTSYLMTHFESQRGRRWFTTATFEAMMRVRGIHAGAPSGYAEGFYGAKLCL
jgi:LmbE family N-acetylglucosaminyl deacetylase